MTCSLTLAPPGGLAFRADLLVQKDLQNKYFANPEGVKKLLDSFRLCLQLKDLNTTFEKSNKGSTGHTYLCSMPTYRITDEKEIQPMEFVLKWQNLAFCTIEKLGAQIFQHFGFHVPKIHQFSKSEATEVMHAAREMDFKLEAMVTGIPLIAMPKIHGGNLTDIIKNGKLKKLSKEDLEILLQKFGQIALLDLIVGNDDRFIGFSSNLKQVFHKSLNPGNVMVEVDQSSPPRLVGVYPIDNCTSADLILKEKEKEEMDFDLFSIFDEQEDLDAPMAAQSKSKEAHSAEIDPKCIAGFNAVFAYLIRHPDILCDHFKKNLETEIQECGKCLDDYQEFLSLLPTHFQIGLKQFMIKVQKDPKFVKILTTELADSNVSNMKTLILLNLKTLNEVLS